MLKTDLKRGLRTQNCAQVLPASANANSQMQNADPRARVRRVEGACNQYLRTSGPGGGPLKKGAGGGAA